jgi:hypothetical protein
MPQREIGTYDKIPKAPNVAGHTFVFALRTYTALQQWCVCGQWTLGLCIALRRWTGPFACHAARDSSSPTRYTRIFGYTHARRTPATTIEYSTRTCTV